LYRALSFQFQLRELWLPIKTLLVLSNSLIIYKLKDDVLGQIPSATDSIVMLRLTKILHVAKICKAE
jgi:hypothetical protein